MCNETQKEQYTFSLQRNLVAQTGDPTGTGKGGESIFLYDDLFS